MKKKIIEEETEEVVVEINEHPDIAEQHRVMVEKAAELQKIAQQNGKINIKAAKVHQGIWN